MPSARLTVDELVDTLKHSSLPTILVEGDDDMMIYRWVEERIGIRMADAFPCGGRKTLLAVYERRTEFSHLKTAFVADRDMWLFTAIPPEYSDVVWTEGYSIENDLYAGSNLEDFLDRDEASEHKKVLRCLIEWFAFVVEEFRHGNEAKIKFHTDQIVLRGTVTISQQFAVEHGFRQPNHATITEIELAYKLKLRGKTLFDLLMRYLNAHDRKIKYQNVKALYEIAFKFSKRHAYMDRLIGKIEYALSNSYLV